MTPQSNRDDAEYFRARALQERVAAARTRTAKAIQCHDELAMMYRFRAAMLSTGPDTWADSLDQRQFETA